MPGTQNIMFNFLLCTYIIILGSRLVQSSSHHLEHHHSHHHHRMATKLFVFGDSYADTGNNQKTNSVSWREPYGVTFPGKPSGRFSDGRVFTDFLAKILGLRSPIAYRWRKYNKNGLRHGMNFAFGGTGVFDTTVPYPNMTTQIDFFERLLNESIFSPRDLRNSVAHVSLAGNDYTAYLARGGSAQGLQKFIHQVVTQLVLDVQRIYKLGVTKISVTTLQPLGCLPALTFQSLFRQCNSTSNLQVEFHNLLLKQAIAKLNKQAKAHDSSPFTIIDLYTAFSSFIQEKGSLMFDNPLKPCCMGINQTYNCGDVDEKGNKMYTVCENRESYFFWDIVHPTQSGWDAVTSALKPTIQELQC